MWGFYILAYTVRDWGGELKFGGRTSQYPSGTLFKLVVLLGCSCIEFLCARNWFVEDC